VRDIPIHPIRGPRRHVPTSKKLEEFQVIDLRDDGSRSGTFWKERISGLPLMARLNNEKVLRSRTVKWGGGLGESGAGSEVDKGIIYAHGRDLCGT